MGSFVAARGLLSSCGMGSVVVARGLSCPAACGILVPRPGIDPAPPALEGRFLTTGPPGKSPSWFLPILVHAKTKTKKQKGKAALTKTQPLTTDA